MRYTVFALLIVLGPVITNAQAVTIAVDVNRDRKPINPNIYGLAYASSTQLRDLNATLNRRGGNPTSRYNWTQNADNRGFDWYFESLPYPSPNANGETDAFVQNSRTGGAEPMLTMPMIDWVAKLGPGRSRLASFSVQKYGRQQGADPGWSDAGNGVRQAGTPLTGNDPNDANVQNSTALQGAWVDALKQRWGSATTTGVKYYLLDNEPSIWFEAHRDVAPTGLTMDQAKQKMIDYALTVKTREPNALVLGPEEWGWGGFIYSGFDQQAGAQNGYTNFPDRNAHGGMDYVPYLLQKMRQAQAQYGRRLLDMLSLHYYPQSGEFSNDVSPNMQLLRNRSTRSLWDPNYVDVSWIGARVNLIPRMRSWVNQHYPGTKIALTEYNWGAEGHINGATAQADCLGIFGREALDLANRWATPSTNSPAYNAFKMYRNYDGRKSTFGETSVRATVPNPDEVAAFAAKRASDGALTIMVINKRLTGNTASTINLTGVTGNRVVEAYQLKASPNRIVRLADLRTTSGRLTATLPSQSITLFVVR